MADRRAKEALVGAIGEAWLDAQPIPRRLRDFAERLGVSDVLLRPLAGNGQANVDAMLVPIGDSYTIVLNERSTDTRRRYSMGHELGHLVALRGSGPSNDRSARFRMQRNEHSDRLEERYCDQIAAEILMPADKFRESAREFGMSLNSLQKLAGFYGTSVTAAALRLAELLPSPGLLVRWSRTQGGPLTPSWQIRNELDGPHVDGISRFGKRRHETFEGAQRAWRDTKCHLTWETLRARASKSSRRYLSLRGYETESIGFGSGSGRFVLSLSYLDRHLSRGRG